MRKLAAVASLALAAAVVVGPASVSMAQSSGLQKVNHIVVIYQENWSFDSLYGHFPGANGLDQARGSLLRRACHLISFKLTHGLILGV